MAAPTPSPSLALREMGAAPRLVCVTVSLSFRWAPIGSGVGAFFGFDGA